MYRAIAVQAMKVRAWLIEKAPCIVQRGTGWRSVISYRRTSSEYQAVWAGLDVWERSNWLVSSENRTAVPPSSSPALISAIQIKKKDKRNQQAVQIV